MDQVLIVLVSEEGLPQLGEPVLAVALQRPHELLLPVAQENVVVGPLADEGCSQSPWWAQHQVRAASRGPRHYRNLRTEVETLQQGSEDAAVQDVRSANNTNDATQPQHFTLRSGSSTSGSPASSSQSGFKPRPFSCGLQGLRSVLPCEECWPVPLWTSRSAWPDTMLCHDWRAGSPRRSGSSASGAPMRFLSSQGNVVDSYDPALKRHRTVCFLCFNGRCYMYRCVKRVLERDAWRTLYRGEARQELPPIVEWKRAAFGAGLFWCEDLREARRDLIAAGEPQSDPQQSLPVQAEAEVRHANP